MAGGSRGGGDVVLGGRHLVGIFALLVVVLGLVFTLGYLLGRSQYENQSPIAASTEAPANPGNPGTTAKSAEPAATPAPAPAESAGSADAPPPANWDFYHSGEPAKTPERLEPAPAPSPVASSPAPKAIVSAPKPPPPATEPSATPAPRISPGGSALIPKGAITLQVAALLRQGDALAMAQVLQEKKFPAIVTTPSTDRYYRVQVGPYADMKAAKAAQKDLETRVGFKSIVRR